MITVDFSGIYSIYRKYIKTTITFTYNFFFIFYQMCHPQWQPQPFKTTLTIITSMRMKSFKKIKVYTLFIPCEILIKINKILLLYKKDSLGEFCFLLPIQVRLLGKGRIMLYILIFDYVIVALRVKYLQSQYYRTYCL